MANAPVAKKDAAPSVSAPTTNTIRVQVRPGHTVALGRDKATRMLIVKRAGEWLDIDPAQIDAMRAHVFTEAEVRDGAGKPAAVSDSDVAALQIEWEAYRARERLRLEREREARKPLLDALVPEPAPASADPDNARAYDDYRRAERERADRLAAARATTPTPPRT